MDISDKDRLVETLLQERDELYQELSRLREIDNGALDRAEKEIISNEHKKPENKKKPVRLALPDHLRRETEVIEPVGIDENWVRIGQEVTEILEHKPVELFVRQIIRPKYALKNHLQKQQEQSEGVGTEQSEAVKIASLPFSRRLLKKSDQSWNNLKNFKKVVANF